MLSKTERLSLREARDWLRDQFFPPADSSDAAWDKALDYANDAIRLALESGQVWWWYVPAGRVIPRQGDSSKLREAEGRDIYSNELRLKTNRDGCFDETITRISEPADFPSASICRRGLETFVTNTLGFERIRLKDAPAAEIDRAIEAVYEDKKDDPPNVNVLVKLVQDQLKRQGYQAPKTQIQDHAKEFKDRRRPGTGRPAKTN